ncbi:cobalt ECF transporter T component CbiQ [Candidatus Formimonas warabiya]|uniref:Cobalt ECF transporter T component CbiQ n=1 Tax=Formimonas warabiya TaxID=1761012 RepID=A0A3G1KUA1_FORW1|nr:cobalt ECF transporter T component CbiQ [Candidatus Formimonas warabiya]ATW26010.1 cobalt ECF transporter T component CbiQ [Candidatus Formimonas warabiya]
MANFASSWNSLRLFDELSAKQTMIHGLHPLAKFLTTLVFIIAIVSFHKYQVVELLPFALYLIVVMVLGDLPPGPIFKRMLISLPFAFGVGIFNPIFDHTPVMVLGSTVLTGGWVSFLSIILRFCFTVLGALLLIATSGIGGVASAMLRLKLPKIFVVQLLFMYRYLSVMLEETARVLRANALRSLRDKGVHFKVWGSLLGQLLLRTIDRAQRIYQAMLCRGFTGEFPVLKTNRISGKDILYVCGWSGYFILARLYNIPEFMGSLFLGGIK